MFIACAFALYKFIRENSIRVHTSTSENYAHSNIAIVRGAYINALAFLKWSFESFSVCLGVFPSAGAEVE